MSLLSKITPAERKDLLIACFALGVAFTISMAGLTIGSDISKVTIPKILLTLAISIGTVGISFIIHEMAHKFSAIKFGYWAEFRKSTSMLLVSLAIAVITGMVFAAPGATIINTAGRQMTKKENGIISAAGPISNIILIIPFLVLMIIGVVLGGVLPAGSGFIFYPFTSAGFIYYLGMIGFSVNAMLALFNMIPAGPLDGKKIFKWNPAIFAVLIIIGIALVFISVKPELIINLFF